MQALIDLSSPTNTLEGLRRFHDLIESHIHSLTSLGRSTDTYSAMLVPYLLRKLPVDTIRILTREHESSEWTIEELQEALLKEIRIFETSLHTAIPQRSNNFGETSSRPTASFHTNVNVPTSGSTHRPSCSYCKSSVHASAKCDIVNTQQARVEFIKQHNLCFNCLGHHRVSRCTSKKRCRQCRRKHHTSLCTNNAEAPASNNSNPSPSSNSSPPQDTSNASVLMTSTTTTLQSIHLTSEPICLLKTAVATVANKSTQVDANILFDEGSQRSFATQVLIDKLQLQPHQTVTNYSYNLTRQKRYNSLSLGQLTHK